MADNTTLNAGTGGDVIATDDIGGVKYQINKLAYGALDTATLVTSSVGLPSDPLDRAARDCGKIDIAMGQGAHDAAGAAIDPVGISGWASAAAPADVTADGDIVKTWCLRNGAQATVVTAAGALIGGDATNGLDVDVTRVTGTVTIAGAVTNAGTFVVQENGAALTALQLLDDTVATLGTTTYTEAATKGLTIGAVRRDADTALVDTTNEIGPLQMDALGRLKVEAFSGETLPVSLASVPSHAVTNAGTFAVQVDGAALTSLQLIDDAVSGTGFNISQQGGVAIALGTGVRAAGVQRVTIATDDIVPASQSGTWTVQPGNTPNTSAWLVQPVSGATGGATAYHLVSAATTNLTNVKASAGTLYGWSVFNTNAAVRYLKLHNTAGAPTAGASVVYTIGVPAGGGSNIDLATGLAFATGIGISTVTEGADSGTTAVGAGDLIINLHYK